VASRAGSRSDLIADQCDQHGQETQYVADEGLRCIFRLVGFGVHEEGSLADTTEAHRVENARVRHLATVTERERAARDPHDVAGQTLTAIIPRSQLVQRMAETDPERAVVEGGRSPNH
jgi:signal transduction histidine kinase